jgi:uncharacterized OsmC-like protein
MAKMTIREIQRGIRDGYIQHPQRAQVEIRVNNVASDLSDPLHCAVQPEAVAGGAGDVPCSADLLLGALAACQETTLRMVAANMGIELLSLDIKIAADWDPRGTLAMGDYPIGLKAIRCETRAEVKGDARGERAQRLLKSAEKYCVVLNTLRGGVPVESSFAVEERTV